MHRLEPLSLLLRILVWDSADAGEEWNERARKEVVDALNRIDDPSARSRLTDKEYPYKTWITYPPLPEPL